MVIEYQIKPFELVKAYFYNLQHSLRTRLIVFGVAFLFFIYVLFLRYMVYRHLAIIDFLVAILSGFGLVLALPVLSFITAKTQKRIFEINPEGIETKIGSKSGKILWTAVESISDTQNRILITGKNANVFSIPTRAFNDEAHRQQFLDLATQYHADANLQD